MQKQEKFKIAKTLLRHKYSINLENDSFVQIKEKINELIDTNKIDEEDLRTIKDVLKINLDNI